MRVESDACVAEQVGQPLWHQDPDLFDCAAQLQDAHIQTWLGPLCAVPVERYLLLKRDKGQYSIINFSEDSDYVLCLVLTNVFQIHCWEGSLKSDV